MEAIVKISGKQYRVAEGVRLTVDRLGSNVGDEVSFGDVLLLTDGAKATVGTPTVDGAAVTVRVVAATRGPKIIVYKYKAKKRYRRTQGARAEQSLLEVLTVKGPGSKAKGAKSETAKKTATETKAVDTEMEGAKAGKAETPKAAADKPARAAAKPPEVKSEPAAPAKPAKAESK